MRNLPIQYITQCTKAVSYANTQITRLSRLGCIDNARKVFDEIPNKNIVSWNSIISGLFQNNRPDQARKLFDEMPMRNSVSWNGVVSGYVKNGMVSEARKVFDLMPERERDVRSWTAMVRGYVQEGMIKEAEALFWRMPEKNVVSWTVMLGGLIGDGRVEEARAMYDRMSEKDVVASSSMIGGYCREGRVDQARELFDELPYRNVVCWTMMIDGYVQNRRVDVARKLFEVMPEKNEVSWTAMLRGYTQYGRIGEAYELFDAMPVKTVIGCNSMIFGFGQKGEVARARMIFEQMTEKDDVTWSTMIRVYEQNGFELQVLKLFKLMQTEGLRPNVYSLISVLSVCASLTCLDNGRQVHAQLVETYVDADMYVASSLITMYVRCGDFVTAKQVFDRFSPKDIVVWNSIITGYAQHGLGEKALQIFYEMCSLGVTPDDITFVGVLSACSYTGNVREGLEIFESMKSKYLVEPKQAHFASMVDLLGRAGRINEAMNLIKKMPVEADAIVWGALLGACKIHMNMNIAEVAATKLLKLEPENAGPSILLSHIYATKGRWAEAAELRRKIRTSNVSKLPGCSWIEVDKRVHMFTGGDNISHPDRLMIIKMLEKLTGLLREAGYCPDHSLVMHDVDQEDRVHSLWYHGERIAVAYGLLKVPERMPIRVMKNLRVCVDCHAAIKLIAKVTGREIVLRDANRFHHFKDGLCSCGDYW